MRRVYRRYRRSWNTLFLVFIFLAVIRMVAPTVTLFYLNRYLADFSPIYRGHIADLDLNIWRGAYKFEGVSLTLKERPLTFATIRDVDISVAWRELLRLKIRADVVVSEAKLLYSDNLRQKVFQSPQVHKKDAENALNKLFPVSVERIQVQNSSLGTADFFGISKELPTVVNDFTATINHLTTDKVQQITYFQAKGLLPGGSALEFAGEVNTYQKVQSGSAKMKLEDFNTTLLNPWMVQMAPMTFEKGQLTVVSEVKIQGSTVSGYFRPFIEDLHVIGDSLDFTSLRQFGIELSLAVLNGLFQDRNDNLAAQVNFTYAQGELDWDLWDVLKSMSKNSRKTNLKKSFDPKK